MEMNEVEFRAVCRDACYELNLKNTGELGEEGVVEVDDVTVGVHFEPESEEIEVFVDLGPIDADRRLEAYEAILEMNLDMDPALQGSIGRDAETDRAIWSIKVDAGEDFNGAALAELLLDLVWRSKEMTEQLAESDSCDAAHEAVFAELA
jgi:hypothetical protein